MKPHREYVWLVERDKLKHLDYFQDEINTNLNRIINDPEMLDPGEEARIVDVSFPSKSLAAIRWQVRVDNDVAG